MNGSYRNNEIGRNMASGMLYRCPATNEETKQILGFLEAGEKPTRCQTSEDQAGSLDPWELDRTLQEMWKAWLPLCDRPRTFLYVSLRDCEYRKDPFVLHPRTLEEEGCSLPSKLPERAGAHRRDHHHQPTAPRVRAFRRRLIKAESLLTTRRTRRVVPREPRRQKTGHKFPNCETYWSQCSSTSSTDGLTVGRKAPGVTVRLEPTNPLTLNRQEAW